MPLTFVILKRGSNASNLYIRNMQKDMPQKIRIAIVEDVVDVAENLRDMLSEEMDFSCLQIYHNAEEAIAFLPKAPADIILVDIGLPGDKNGIDLISILRPEIPESQFCMFTVFEDDDKIFSSIKAGAKGYVLKNSKPSEIINSIRELHFGGSPISPTIARKVIDAFSQPQSEKVNTELPLTRRELELLDHLSKGLLYKEIAMELNIKIGTVKQHVHNIYEKLQVNNKMEAVNMYLKR